MAFQIRERSRLTPQGRLSLDLGENVRNYFVFDESNLEREITVTELQQALTMILGRTNARPQDPPATPGTAGPGSIARVMPWCDPAYPCLFAEDVSVSHESEEGSDAGNAAGDPDRAVDVVSGHNDFKAYNLAVRYTTRPYAIFPDSRLVRQSIDFDTPAVGVRKRLYYYREWLRFLRIEARATDTRVSASQGSAFHFRAPGAFYAGQQIDGIPYAAIPDMMVQDENLTLSWYGIPARYLEDSRSFLVKYRGFINQFDFWNWPKGSLLYLNVDTIRSYTQLTFTPAGAEDVAYEEQVGTFAHERMVDLALHFIWTTREPGIDYTNVDVLNAIRSNPNYLPAGHNLFPFFPDRKYYYATAAPFEAVPDKINHVPAYFSVPFEILFQDPTRPENLILI